MHEVFRDPEVMAAVIRRRVLRAMVPAVRKLDRVARGITRFGHDQERLACIVLARLAPLALACAAAGDDRAEADEEWERWMTPERVAAFERLRRPRTRDEIADTWAREFLAGASMPMGVDTLEKAREFGGAQWDHCEASAQLIRRKHRSQRRRR